MSPERVKTTVFIVLCISFLSYSTNLYYHQPQVQSSLNNADEGKLIWQKYNCGACHQLYGLGGYLGPDLTNVYSRKGVPQIHAFLRTGSTIMPDFKLSELEIDNLTSFLATVDASGNSDPRLFKKNLDGTIEQ
jgi:nitric oxide reductase subunit C